jgi:hypothetical protein
MEGHGDLRRIGAGESVRVGLRELKPTNANLENKNTPARESVERSDQAAQLRGRKHGLVVAQRDVEKSLAHLGTQDERLRQRHPARVALPGEPRQLSMIQ